MNEGNKREANESMKLIEELDKGTLFFPVQYNQIPEWIWLLPYGFHLLKKKG